MRVKHRTEEYNLTGVTQSVLQGRARLKGDYSNMDMTAAVNRLHQAMDTIMTIYMKSHLVTFYIEYD